MKVRGKPFARTWSAQPQKVVSQRCGEKPEKRALRGARWAMEPQPRAACSASRFRTENRMILLVDDDAQVRLTIGRGLTELVTRCARPRAARRLWSCSTQRSRSLSSSLPMGPFMEGRDCPGDRQARSRLADHILHRPTHRSGRFATPPVRMRRVWKGRFILARRDALIQRVWWRRSG